MGNQALQVNPIDRLYTGTPDINITTHGSDWYFAVCAVMFASTLAFIGLSFTVPRRNRLFHYITAAITLTAAIAYFTMGSNLGYTPIAVEFLRRRRVVRGSYREVFYVRYIDWFITTPLLLLDLLLTAGLPWPTLMWTIFLDEVMIITGLVGALVSSSYKWGYFVFATMALFGVAWNVVVVARRHANGLGPNVSRTFLICGAWTIFLWFLYPIAWGLSEGGNVIAPDSEAVFYGVLDILSKPVFGAMLILGHRNINPSQLGLHIRDYDDNVAHEKTGNGTHTANNGVTTDVPATGTGTTGTTAGTTTGTATGTTTGTNPARPATSAGATGTAPGATETAPGVTETAPGLHIHNIQDDTIV